MDELFRVFTIKDGEIIEGAEESDLITYLCSSRKRVLLAKVILGPYGGCEIPERNETIKINDDSIVAVIDVQLGMFSDIFFGNSKYDHDHTGDRIGWKCQRMSCGFFKDNIMEKPDQCPKCGAGSKTVEAKQSAFVSYDLSDVNKTIDDVVDEVSGLFQESFNKKLVEDESPAFVFGEFPEKIKVLSRVFSINPQGKLMVALVPSGVVFRVIHSVTESGDFQAKYYKWNGKKFHVATETERSLSKDF